MESALSACYIRLDIKGHVKGSLSQSTMLDQLLSLECFSGLESVVKAKHLQMHSTNYDPYQSFLQGTTVNKVWYRLVVQSGYNTVLPFRDIRVKEQLTTSLVRVEIEGVVKSGDVYEWVKPNEGWV